MTAICPGGGPSQMIQGNSTALVFAAGSIGSYLNNHGMGWAYVVAPMLGALTFDLPSFCAGDPPTLPTIDAARVAGWFNPLNPTGAADLRQAMGDLVGYFVWYDFCECTGGGTPPPAPAPQVPNLSINPGIGPTTSTAPCWDVKDTITVGGSGTLYGFHQNRLPPANSAWMEQQHVRVTCTTNSDGTTAPNTIQVSAHNQDGSFPTLIDGVTPFFQLNVPVGQTKVFEYVAPNVPTDVAINVNAVDNVQSNSINVEVQIWCGGALPTTPASNCCPPDPTLTSLMSQILNQVNLIQRQIVPFAYVPSTVHSAVSGTGELDVSGLFGLKISPSAFPTGYGLETGDPDSLWLDSWIRWGNADGWGERKFLTAAPYVSLPELAGQYTKVGYTFRPGLVCDITELVREP